MWNKLCKVWVSLMIIGGAGICLAIAAAILFSYSDVRPYRWIGNAWIAGTLTWAVVGIIVGGLREIWRTSHEHPPTA